MTPIVQRKVIAYVTHASRLLVFTHPESPEAGIQVPAGTVEAGEDPVVAALREAREETGLDDLTVDAFLGESWRTFADPTPAYPTGVTFHRHFYHLLCHGDPPETWRHYEPFPADGSPRPILFDLFWVALPDGVPDLVGDQDQFLPQLIAVLGGADPI